MASQNKRVHFFGGSNVRTYHLEDPANVYTDNIVPQEPPRTPSPVHSDSSLDYDSSGPSTPPSAQSFPPRGLPLTYGSPMPKPQPVFTNPFIYDMRSQSTPLDWNVTLPPMNATIRSNRKGKGKDSSALLPSDLALPVTSPGMTSLDIYLAALPPFWKPVKLRRSTSITIGDVLNAVYDYSQTRITEKEYALFPKEAQNAMTKAFWKRRDIAERAGNRAEAVAIEQGGLRRVDAMGRHTQFHALLPTSSTGDVFQIILTTPQP